MNFFQGDIVLVPFPFSDNSDKPKLRPAVVISNAIVNKGKDVILAQITTNIRNDDFSFLINENTITNSLRERCEIRCHKLFTADKNIITKKISKFKDGNYTHIKTKIESLIV